MATIESKSKKRRFKKGRSDGVSCGAICCLLVLATLLALFFLIAFSSEDGVDVDDKVDEPVSGAAAAGINGGAAVPPHLFQYNASEIRHGLRSAVRKERLKLERALRRMNDGGLPPRLRTLRDRHAVVGERLADVRSGTETVEEVLHRQQKAAHDRREEQQGEVGVAGGAADGGNIRHTSDKPPMDLEEIVSYLDNWIHTLHETLIQHKHSTPEGVWDAYHDLTVKTLYPWYVRCNTKRIRFPFRVDYGRTCVSLHSQFIDILVAIL